MSPRFLTAARAASLRLPAAPGRAGADEIERAFQAVQQAVEQRDRATLERLVHPESAGATTR